jgi:hypothetical protein
MRILFLDDDRFRHETFLGASVGHAVTAAFNASEAITALESGEFDLVYLDHDLGGEESEGLLLDGAEDGRFVAGAIAGFARLYPDAYFVVHSLNFGGASSMVESLREAGLMADHIPFAWKRSPQELFDRGRQSRLRSA